MRVVVGRRRKETCLIRCGSPISAIYLVVVRDRVVFDSLAKWEEEVPVPTGVVVHNS